MYKNLKSAGPLAKDIGSLSNGNFCGGFMSGYNKEYVEYAKEHKECFGNYYDADGNVCEDGSSGLCNYCVECQRECIYY